MEQTDIFPSTSDVFTPKQNMKKTFGFGPKFASIGFICSGCPRDQNHREKKTQIPIHEQTAKISFSLYSYHHQDLAEHSLKPRQYIAHRSTMTQNLLLPEPAPFGELPFTTGRSAENGRTGTANDDCLSVRVDDSDLHATGTLDIHKVGAGRLDKILG